MYSIIQLRNSIFLTILFLYTIFVRWSIRSSYVIFIRFVRVNDIVNIQKLNEFYIYIILKVNLYIIFVVLKSASKAIHFVGKLCADVRNIPSTLGVQVMKMLIWCFEFSCLNFKLDIFVNCSYCSILFFSFLY